MSQIHIQRALCYIEEHLRDDSALDNATLASLAGYSEYHFLRVFHRFVHLTPADYIRKRRITEIVKQIVDSNRSISDIAFEYGFNSKENFTRAFKSEHNLLPTEFRAVNCSLRLFEPFTFDSSFRRPEISIGFLKGFTLIAYPFGDGFAPHCWNRYNAEHRSQTLSGNTTTEDYGAMMWNSEKNQLEYYIGVPAQNANGDTASTVSLAIGEGLYAVFVTPPATQHTFVDTVRSTWDWIYREWMPSNGYKRADGFELESYTESSHKYSETIYIPIEKERE